MRIVFMGTPEFATGPLRALMEEGFDIAGVVTAPDKPAGRGRKIQQSDVRIFVEKHLECPIFQPENLKDPALAEDLKLLNPDLFIVVAFRMLPEVIWSIPRLGTFNLHASLLPQYRGAAPINHAIINGEKMTGVTTFFIDQKIDTGRILFQEKVAIEPSDDAGSLHDKLMVAGSGLVVHTARSIASGKASAVPQESYISPDDRLKTAPKLFKEDCRINWNLEGNSLHNFIRGLSPFPAAYSHLQKSDSEKISCKIFSGTFQPEEHLFEPGTIRSDGKTYLKVAVPKGFYDLQSLQIAGKKRMSVAEWLMGFKEHPEDYRFT